jgi:hypothetical protein
LPRLASNHNPPDLSLPSIRITGVSHQCLASENCLNHTRRFREKRLPDHKGKLSKDPSVLTRAA